MTENVSAFNEFILKSAELYIHTVVLIDDRIYESKIGNVTAPLTKPSTGRRKMALKSVTIATDKKIKIFEGAEDSEKPDEVSFHDVQNSFAKKRIVCSLYQPKKSASFSERSEVCCLCSSADVVIIDWDLHGDPGLKATELVVNLIDQSMKEIPHQLQLILIYTMEVNLRSVADTIFEYLSKRIGEETIVVDPETEGLVITTNNARVVVLGKVPNTSLPQYSKFWVSEKKLAERTIWEFSRIASGLLQSVVLRGIAHLRDNNRRILMRFHDGIDSAFLAHRALLLPDEAFGQIIPLLTDELRAVLEDTLGECPIGSGPAVERIIADWCAGHWKPGNNSRLNIGDGADALEFAKDVFCNGPLIKNDYSRFRKSEIPGLVDKRDNEPVCWNEKKCLKLAEYLSSDSDGNPSHEMLSSLMSQRIAYENASRTLHLGVFLREMAGKQRYMLCLQPVCDSIRINGEKRAFIFCFLDIPEVGKSFTHAVMDLNRKLIKLSYKPKISKCHVSIFSAGTDAVCATKDSEGRFIFEDESKSKYEWIAELKTEHAQSAAEEFGRTLSRVGLTESEWLRLKAKKFFR